MEEFRSNDLGTWVVKQPKYIPLVFTCSKCQSDSSENFPYCPYCGKQMNPDWVKQKNSYED